MVERVFGASRTEPVVFAANGTVLSDGGKYSPHSAGADQRKGFVQPPSFSFRTPDCPTCGTNTKGKKN